MSESKMEFTPEQMAVITAEEGNLLVSAAAGSGKTAVMTERIVKRLASGEATLESMLILTFTNAASESMKKKIRHKLAAAARAAIAGKDEIMSKRLAEQTLYLPQANISTIHAFCLWLIQNFPHEARNAAGQTVLEADFMTIDEVLADRLRDEAVAEVLQQHYLNTPEEGAQPGPFWRLVYAYSGPRQDSRLRELMLSLYNELRSLPHYRDVIQQALERLKRESKDFVHSEAYALLMTGLKRRLALALSDIPRLRSYLENPEFYIVKDNKKNEVRKHDYLAILERIEALSEVSDHVSANNAVLSSEQLRHHWDTIVAQSAELSWTKPRLSANSAPELADFTDLLMSSLADVLYYLNAKGSNPLAEFCRLSPERVFVQKIEMIEADLQSACPVIECLFSLVLEMDELYAAKKQRIGGIDFSDYEHLALSILESEAGSALCRRLFKEAYIDEYQDTSSIQEQILEEVLRIGRFMVGDVKQSIYRFRHARPENFIKRAADYKTGQNGRYFELMRNFRSEAGILEGINEVFARVMTAEFSGIDYLAGHAMTVGREGTRANKRIRILEQLMSDADDSESGLWPEDGFRDLLFTRLVRHYPTLAVRQFLEADEDLRAYIRVAEEIRCLHENGVPYADMAVMARKNGACDRFAQLMELLEIPQNRRGDQVLYDSYTIRLQRALLAVLDNARQDIPLAAVMLSELLPLCFTEAELLLIKTAASVPKSDLYTAVRRQAEDHSELGQKCADFLRLLGYWREQATRSSVRRLLERIWYESDYKTRVLREEGEEGLRQLEQFAQTISLMDKEGYVGLHTVVSQIEAEILSRQDGGRENDNEGEGVHILTFHKSKGLEFPYVFLLDLHKMLTDKGSNDPVLFSEEQGISFDVPNETATMTYPSLLKIAGREKRRQRYLTEEICLFYVAMSRARTALYLCTRHEKIPERETLKAVYSTEAAGRYEQAALPSELIQTARSYQDLLEMALAAHPETELRRWASGHGELQRQAIIGVPDGLYAVAEHCPWQVMTYDDLDSYRNWLSAHSLRLNEMGKRGAEKAETTGTEMMLKQVALPFTKPEDLTLHDFYTYDMTAFKALPKQSVSELKRMSQHLAQQEEEFDIGNINRNLLPLPDVSAVSGGQERVLQGAQLGVVLHTVMRFIKPEWVLQKDGLQKTSGLLEIRRQLGLITEIKQFTELEVKALGEFGESFLRYCRSDLVKRMLSAAEPGRSYKRFHEIPFTYRYIMNSGQESLVQGIIDLWFYGSEGPELVDYKSDHLPMSDVEAQAVLLERYCEQLRIYAMALEQMLGEPLARISIWAIRKGREFSFDRALLGLK